MNSRFSINLWHLTRNASNKFADMQLQFYETVKEMHGTDVIIDGQKELRKLKILNGILKGKANVKVLHLVRDPRGFLNSSKKYINRQQLRKYPRNGSKCTLIYGTRLIGLILSIS